VAHSLYFSCCAVLCCAVLCCAVLCCAVLCCALLCCALLCCVIAVTNRNPPPHPPFIYSLTLALTYTLTYTQVGDHADNVSDDSSVDAYSVSEVSLDDAPSSRMTLAVTRVIAPPSTSNAGVLPYMTVGAIPRASVPMDPSAPSVRYPESDVGPKGGGGLLDVGPKGGGGLLDVGPKGGGGLLDVGPKGGGGLLDATRSSAVSSMLQSAKQNQSNISDGSDDDWDE
jgi:hypothetical protein